MLWSWSYCR